jgi:hypothetical protein
MPIINMPDPTNVAAGAIGSYLQSRNAETARQAALNYQKQKDAQQQSNADRSFGLDKQRTDSDVANVNSQVASRKQADDIAKADETFTRSLDSINLQLKQLDLDGKRTSNADAASLASIHAAQAKYADALAKAGVDTATANSKVAKITAQYAPQMAA